jgi:hypothetical protein
MTRNFHETHFVQCRNFIHILFNEYEYCGYMLMDLILMSLIWSFLYSCPQSTFAMAKCPLSDVGASRK